jgi:hypothetical protein
MSDSNPDVTDPRYDSSERRDDGHDDQSDPERWILICATALLAFGILLLALRSVIFSLILMMIGISLFAYWLYVGVREREQRRIATNYGRNSSSVTSAVGKRDNVCACSICKHTESSSCLEIKCPCCILTRNKQIIGHFHNPP